MEKKIVQMLHLALEPVGIFLGNTSAKSELEASPQKRNCEFLLCWLLPKEKSHLWMKRGVLALVVQSVPASVMVLPV